MNVRPGNLIFDMDEVLFNISPYMYKKIRLNWDEFFPFLKDKGPQSDKQIFERDTFYFNEWLIKDQFKNSKPIKDSIRNAINKMCFTESLYDTLSPTPLAQRTLLNKNFIDNSVVQSCTILTRSVNSETTKAKQKTLEKYFSHPKIKFKIINLGESKAETLKELGINWNVVFDDEIRNIKEIAENFDLERREFIIPEMGYNKIPPEVKLLIHEKGGTITYYDCTK